MDPIPFDQAQQRLGVNLPNVDPAIGESVLNTILGNPQASLPDLLAVMVRQVPEEVAAEVAQCFMEILACKAGDGLRWVEAGGMSILTGVRKVSAKGCLQYGNAMWPDHALMMGPPTSAIIRTGDGPARVWVAGPDLKGVSVRQSEAVALGNLMIERFGGRVLEDRQGPDVLREAYIEQNMTERARNRAKAQEQADKLTLAQEANPGIQEGYARAPLYEALPGGLKPGQEVVPEAGDTGAPDLDAPVYVVERRAARDWVIIRAKEPGMGQEVQACAWLFPDGSTIPNAPEAYVGFTEDRTKS